MKKKIIHLVNSKIYSGLEKVAIEIIESLNDDIDFFYACQDGPIVGILKEKNINRIKINGITKSEIERIEKEYNPDIIHAHDYRATLICGLYAKNTKIIAHLHNNSPFIKKKFHPYNYLLLLALKSKNVKKVYLVSESIKDEYIFSKYINNKIEIIGNPISCHNIQKNIDLNIEKEYDICFVGRLTEQKNPLRFIDIMYQITKENEYIKAVMLGDGILFQEGERKIRELNIGKNLEMKGFSKNVYNEMVKSKIFCLTSDWEGYGLVVFEALALGVPVVTSNVGGIPNIIDSTCGFLCNNENDFLYNIKNLLNNENYKNLKNNCLKRAKEIENYQWYMEHIKNIYESI